MKSQPKSSRIIFTVSGICLAFLVMIWVSYFRQRSYDREDAVRFAVTRNSNLAVALEQYAIRTLHNADAILQLVKMAYATEGDALDLHQLLSTNSLHQDIVSGVFIIDPKGQLVKSSIHNSSDSAINLCDRSYFIFHSKYKEDTLLLSKPLISRTIGETVIVISRRISDRQGRFAGIVALQIKPSVFTSFYAQAQLLPNDIISLIAPDGTTYARRTGSIESDGENISKSPLFAHVANHPDSFYFAKDAIKGIPTWFSYRKLNDYPIIATVGRSEGDMLAAFTDRQSRYILPRIVVSLLVILFSAFIIPVLRNRQNLAIRLAEEEKRYQRLLTEQVIAAQEREREWIGRELHDNVNQVLTTVKLYLDMASHNQGGQDPLIPRSMQLINTSISEIRSLSHQLSSPTLGTRSLVDSMNALIEMIEDSTPLAVDFHHKGYKEPVIMNQQLALYRIVQEQLNNIIKHSDATEVTVWLSQTSGKTFLVVRDNGKGFDTNSKANGMGFNNIISRVKIFNGEVSIESAPQRGCFLKVSVPTIALN